MATYYKKWTRAEIQEEINAAMKQAVVLKESCIAALNDLDLSEQGRKKRISQLIESMGTNVKEHLHRAAEMVKDLNNRLSNDALLDEQRANEASHQLRMANAMKTLELRGSSITKKEFIELIQPLAFDLAGQQSIRAAAQAGGMSAWQAGAWAVELYAPVIARRTVIDQLKGLAEHLENCWNDCNSFERVTGYEASFVFCTVNAKLNHWNDDMTEYH